MFENDVECLFDSRYNRIIRRYACLMNECSASYHNNISIKGVLQ